MEWACGAERGAESGGSWGGGCGACGHAPYSVGGRGNRRLRLPSRAEAGWSWRGRCAGVAGRAVPGAAGRARGWCVRARTLRCGEGRRRQGLSRLQPGWIRCGGSLWVGGGGAQSRCPDRPSRVRAGTHHPRPAYIPKARSSAATATPPLAAPTSLRVRADRAAAAPRVNASVRSPAPGLVGCVLARTTPGPPTSRRHAAALRRPRRPLRRRRRCASGPTGRRPRRGPAPRSGRRRPAPWR